MRAVLVMLMTTALVACSEGQATREAGYELSPDFGNSTLMNTAVMSGERDFAIEMSRAFAAQVPSVVNFAFNSAELDADAKRRLDAQAEWIKRFPDVRFRVFGHTDLVGSERYNKALGLRRAEAVVAYLGTRGISRSRLEAVASFGETQPLVHSPGPERENRRAVTEIAGLVRGHPALLNGKYAATIFREYVASATTAWGKQSSGGGGTATGGGATQGQTGASGGPAASAIPPTSPGN